MRYLKYLIDLGANLVECDIWMTVCVDLLNFFDLTVVRLFIEKNGYHFAPLRGLRFYSSF